MFEKTNYASVVRQQADGKLILGGLSDVNGNDESSFLRYNPDGSLDTSFASDGVLTTDLQSNLALNFQQNGNLIVSGTLYSTSNMGVIRYFIDGTIDPSFATNGVLTPNLPIGKLSKINVMDDDSILLTGSSYDSNTFSIIFQKYLPNGTLDTSFGTNGTLVNEIGSTSFIVENVKTNSNNTYIIAVENSETNFQVIISKFSPDYILDQDFGTSGVSAFNFGPTIYFPIKKADFDIFGDGSIYIAGGHGICQDVYTSFHAKLKPNGEKDPTFGDNGVKILASTDYLAEQVVIQENNRILISGTYFNCFEWFFVTISRYFSGGFEDPSFNLEDTYQEISFDSMQLLADGKIIMAGTTPWYTGSFGSDFAIVRYNNTVLGVPEFKNQNITVYPNPFNGIFTVQNNFTSEKETYQITDITGKTIDIGELDSEQTQIDLSSAQSGLYFLKTSNGVFRLLKN